MKCVRGEVLFWTDLDVFKAENLISSNLDDFQGVIIRKCSLDKFASFLIVRTQMSLITSEYSFQSVLITRSSTESVSGSLPPVSLALPSKTSTRLSAKAKIEIHY